METINICLKILAENKKAVKESFQLKQIPKFASAVELKNYIVSEKVKAANVESLEIGYYGPPRGTRFAIIDETTLAEAYSTEKQEWIVIWVWTPADRVANKRQSQSSTAVASSNAKRLRLSSEQHDGEDDFSDMYKRLVEKHGSELPDFKFRVWARMLVQLRGEILRQLRELKDLKDADVLDSTQFENQKRILLTELNGLQ
ncbi:uncharacterized protein [Porites lutea]|uniref:uncharacterized protein isoform X1 n=1 Tax=Porites lutea TaxID=51062 RepID=UPI003CC5A6DA